MFAIQTQILGFHKNLTLDSNHRYLSWEHCYSYFRKQLDINNHDHLDTAALHLAFYLASWGMYRGSSPLLWKDYRIHKPAIQKLFEPQFKSLWDLKFDDPAQDLTSAKQIESLAEEIRSIYRGQITTVNGKPKPNFQPSDVLITKILLGTLGCTPACDRFFIDGFRHSKLPYSRFGNKFLMEVFRFYRKHGQIFLETQESVNKLGEVHYPAMKLADMYFWQIGFQLAPPKAQNIS